MVLGVEMKIDNEKLINQLADDLEPIKGKPGRTRMAICLWILLSTTATIICTYLLGDFRPNSLTEFMADGFFMAEVALAILVIVFSVKAAFDLSIPSEKSLFKHLLWPLVFFVLWLLLFIFALGYGGEHVSVSKHHRRMCYLEVLAYSLIPIIIGALWMNTQWLYHRIAAAMVLGLAAGVIPATIMQFACKHEVAHALYFHVLPGMVCSLLGLLIALFMIKKR